MASRLRRSVPVTVNAVLDGRVKLDLECLDRLYLHGYLGQLQVGGQVIQFLNHRGYPVPSPACLQQIGDAFRRRVASFAEANLYRSRTRRRACELRFGRLSELRQDRGLCLSVCCT